MRQYPVQADTIRQVSESWRTVMTMRWTFALILVGTIAAPHAAQDKRRDDLKKPLVLASQGSFFVGGETKPLSPTPPGGGDSGGRGNPLAMGDITVNQMYVQYQIPPRGDQHVPVVMVHGCCLSSKTWETTPDGRMGWSEYFVRRDRRVYLADQSSRARSGFDPTSINAVREGSAPPNQLPNILTATHQFAWTGFRFGPTFKTAFPDGQFPVEAVDELYKQMIPDLNATLPSPNPTLTNLGALAVLLGGAVLMGHSESGFFPEQAALLNADGIKGLISIEMPCVMNPFGAPTQELTSEQIAVLAKIPTLVMFGDHLGDVQGLPMSWADFYQGCERFVGRLKAAGGDAEMMYLPKMGVRGNSHMLMQDRNNLDLADLILNWIDAHVENKKGARR
jgi:pimeloyl-ACP methyl ester carboxylesterase